MQFNFDASTVAPNLGFSPIPANKYAMAITAAEQKPTRETNGAYLEIVWQVTQGEYAGRKVFERLNLWNSNPQAVEMAYGTLSSILRATGKIRFQDTSELIGQTCIVEVSVRDGGVNKQTGEQYEPQNRIKAYHSPTGQPLTQIGGGPGAAQPWAQGAGVQQPPPGVAGGFPSPGAPAQPAFNPSQAVAQAPAFAPPAGGQPAWAQGAPMQAPPPAANVPVAPAQAQPIKRMTAAAGGFTLEQYLANGWTEEGLVQAGMLEIVQPQPVAPAIPQAPQQPPMPPMPGQGFAPQAPIAPQQPAPPQAPGMPQQQWQPPQGAQPVQPAGLPQPGQAAPPAPWAR